MAISITIISDTHGNHKQVKLPGGDILLHCGDFTRLGHHDEAISFLSWYDKQPYTHRVYIAGNHDLLYERNIPLKKKLISFYPDIHYLQDHSIELEGLKIYGSPWQPEFCDWAFNFPRGGYQLKAVWDRIPDSTDILITHTAPYGMKDPNTYGHPVGCEILRNRVEKIAPRLHCFGHLHAGWGVQPVEYGSKITTFVNASICNDFNQVKNPPINIVL